MNTKFEDQIINQISKEMDLPYEVINAVIKSTNRFIIKEMSQGSIDNIDELQTISLPVIGKFIPKKNLIKWKKK
jgi:hypothetical protein